MIRSTSFIPGAAAQHPAPHRSLHPGTQARARAQRAALKARRQGPKTVSFSREQQTPPEAQARRTSSMSLAQAIEGYLHDHAGGNHSPKTLEWHATALGLLRQYLEERQHMTQVQQVTASAISGWFAALRTTLGHHGKPRTERTVQTYARSARAFFHWLVRQEAIERNPFDQVIFPKVGRPRIQTLEPEEFERLLLACTPPTESGTLVERAAARNRGRWSNGRQPGIGPSSGSSMIQASASRSYAGCAWAIWIASEGC